FHRVVRPLPRALALQLVGEGGHVHQELLGRGVDRALAVLEVKEYAHAGLGERLERIGHFDRLSAEARLLAHDEYLKGWPRLERVQEPGQAGASVAEFRAG